MFYLLLLIILIVRTAVSPLIQRFEIPDTCIACRVVEIELCVELLLIRRSVELFDVNTCENECLSGWSVFVPLERQLYLGFVDEDFHFFCRGGCCFS